MAYSKELFEYGREVLNHRRQRAFQALEERKRELYSCLPRLEEIENELSMTGYAAIRAAKPNFTKQHQKRVRPNAVPFFIVFYERPGFLKTNSLLNR